ncbi:MAG: DUF1579 family protein [Acidobacteria bacterium]|nr:DUF1579 family protein [Acidobacteriota bacterium]
MMVSRSILVRSVIVGLMCATLPVSAQQQEARPAGPVQGQRGPGPEGRRLAFLVGMWEEKVSYPAGSPEQKAEEGTGRWFARPMMGRYLQFNYEGTGSVGPYRALGVLAYDREEQNFRLFWFDDTGGVGDYRGNFVDENTLSLEHRGKVDGRDFRERISYTRVSPAEIHTKIEQAWEGGEYRVYLEAHASRTGGPPQGPLRREPAPARPPGS